MAITPHSTVAQISAALRSGDVTSQTITQEYINAINASTLNAVVTRQSAVAALAAAAAADARYAAGTTLSPIDGIPYTLKTVHATSGMLTSNGSSTVSFTPAADGDIAAALNGAGAVLLGKTNIAADPVGSGCQLFGAAHNARNPAYDAGGSSAGAAVAVAAGLTGFDIGADDAGSIRIPASFNGVYGLKATTGIISGAGDAYFGWPSNPPFSADLSSYGPIARSLADIETILPIIAGPTSARPCTRHLQPATSPTLRNIVYVPQISDWYCDSFVTTPIATLLGTLQDNGINVTTAPDVSWFSQTDLTNIYNGMVYNPGNLQHFFASSLSPWYAGQLNYNWTVPGDATARAHCGWLAELLMRDVLANADVILTGTTALSPPAFGQPPVNDTAYLAFTALFNLTGNPAVTLPLGTDPATGVSCGVQLVGRHDMDFDLLHFASQVDCYLPGYQPP